ncbi:MAG: hypothetical protein HYZ89_00860 [Candidatus Omnitrophica bacterium]|nr:hypothetical protein [Candidatus Omnitrophota bacterium]
MRKTMGALAAAVLVGTFGGDTARGAEDHNKERYELAEALERAKVTLAQGLTASESEGTPISGKFEVEDGKLQLSVYTMKGGRPIAEVTLINDEGEELKAVSEELD